MIQRNLQGINTCIAQLPGKWENVLILPWCLADSSSEMGSEVTWLMAKMKHCPSVGENKGILWIWQPTSIEIWLKKFDGFKKGVMAMWRFEGVSLLHLIIWNFHLTPIAWLSYYVIYNHNWHILAKNEWGNTNLSHYHRRKVLPWKWRTEEVENNLLCL